MKATLDKPIYRLIADAMLMDGQWEQIPAPVFKWLFKQGSAEEIQLSKDLLLSRQLPKN